MKFQHFRELTSLILRFRGCFIFLKEQFFNGLKIYQDTRNYLCSDIVDRCSEDENNSIMKYESRFLFDSGLAD